MESLIFWNPKRRPLRIVRCFACKRPFMRGSLNKLHPGLRTLDSRILNSFRLIARPTPSPYPPGPRFPPLLPRLQADQLTRIFAVFCRDVAIPSLGLSVCVNFANTTDSARFKHNYYFNYSPRNRVKHELVSRIQGRGINLPSLSWWCEIVGLFLPRTEE